MPPYKFIEQAQDSEKLDIIESTVGVEDIREFVFKQGASKNLSALMLLTAEEFAEAADYLKPDGTRHLLREMSAFGLGLVGKTPESQNTAIVMPTSADIQEIFRVRLLLETDFCLDVSRRCRRDTALRLAVHDHLDRLHRKMCKLQQEMALHLKEHPDQEKQMEEDEPRIDDDLAKYANEFWNLDRDFHRQIAVQANCRLSAVFIGLIRDKLRLVSNGLRQIVRQAKTNCDAHGKILDAITESYTGDDAAADQRVRDAVREHLVSTIKFFDEQYHDEKLWEGQRAREAAEQNDKPADTTAGSSSAELG